MTDKAVEKKVVEKKPIIDVVQFKKDLEYSMADLSGAMYKQDKLAGHYGVLAVDAQRAAGKAKVVLQTITATVYKEVRDNATKEKLKLTEAQVNAEVEIDKRVRRAKLNLNDANYYSELGRTVTETFRQRRDMLTQISKHDLVDRQGEMSLDALGKKAIESISAN